MKKLLLSASVVLLASVAFCQVPRLSLHEEFTGETCPPCASSDPGFDAILASPANQPKIVSIKWMTPIPAAPTPTWSLYRTNQTEINWRYLPSPTGYGYTTQFTPTTTATNGVLAAPQGQLDGMDQWSFGATGNHVNYMNDAVVDSAHSFSSPFSVTMAKALNANMTVMTLTVVIVAAQDFSATGSLIFRAVMIEKTVTFSIAPGFSGQTVFNNPVIASFPSLQAGTPLAQIWTTGQSQTFVLTCPVPAYRRDINQVDMVGFIQDDGTQKVEQAVRASDCSLKQITLSGPTEVCIGQSATLTAGGGTTYSWSNGLTGSSIVVPASNTNYWVMSTDAGACNNIAVVGLRASTCTGLNNYEAQMNAIKIYPNPNLGEFSVDIDDTNTSSLLVVYDVVGKKVFEQNLQPGKTSIRTGLAKGLYTYSIIRDAKPLHTARLVIE